MNRCSTEDGGRSGPRLSIGLAVYNGADYLEDTVRSILAQDYTDYELIISDNASTDHTRNIAHRLAAEDDRIRIILQPENRGASANWNAVSRAATGEYFKWASHNDRLGQGFLRQCIEVLDTRDDVVLCYPRAVLMSDDGQKKVPYTEDPALVEERASDRFIRILDHTHLNNAHAGVMRLSVLRSTHGDRGYAHGDWALMAELALRGKFWLLEDHLFYRRFDEQSASTLRHAKDGSFADFVNPHRGFFQNHARTWCEQLDFFASALRAPVPATERLRAAGATLRRMPARRASLWAEFKRVIRHGLFEPLSGRADR